MATFSPISLITLVLLLCTITLVAYILITRHKQKNNSQKDNELTNKIKYLENIIAMMPGHVYWKNKQGIILGCNDNQARSAGFKNRYEMIGKTDYEMPWHEQADQLTQIDKEIIATGVERSIEEPSLLANGKQAVFLSKKIPLFMQSECVGILGISIDITERKEIEDALESEKLRAEKAEESAQKANASKSMFLVAIERIIRTDLSCILGAAQVLQRRSLNPEAAEFIDIINETAQEVVPALDRVHYYLGLEQEHHPHPIYESLFNLKDFLEKLIAPYQEEAKTKLLSFYFDYPVHMPLWVKGDHRLIRQVLLNLLDNAAKYTAKGSISCIVSHRPRDTTHFELIVTIKDTGKGIREDVQTELFNLFSPKNTNEPVFTEAGLNLSISAKLLQMMKGSIKVESKLHQGSTFTMTLPLVIGEPPQHSNSYSAGYSSSGTQDFKLVRPRNTPIRALYLEDHTVVQHVVKAMLTEAYRCELDQAYTLEDALKRIGQPYDIIFCDINLPDGSGLDFMRALKQHMGKKAPRVIVITTFLGEDEYIKMGEAGATDLLAKPFDLEELTYMVDKYVFSDWKEDEDD